MKKFLALLIGAAGTLFVNAQSFTFNSLKYDVLSSDDRTCMVSGFVLNPGFLEIPSEVVYEENVYTVTEIAEGAFKEQSLSSVVFPETLQVIGAQAFLDTSGFQDIEIPNSVTAIGTAAFMRSRDLTTLQLSDNLEIIEPETFSYCQQLQSIIIPNSVRRIEESAFYICTSVSALSLGENVEYIGKLAFSNIDQVQSVTIPNSVSEIGNRAFVACDKLSVVEVGTGVQTINMEAFSYGRVSTVIFRSETPPSLTSSFAGVFSTRPKVIVPEGAVRAYCDAWELTEDQVITASNADNIVLNESAVTFRKGEKVQLKAETQPEGAVIIWSTSNPDLVQISQDGVISTFSDERGEVIITASSLEGNAEAQCRVTLERWFDFTENPITVFVDQPVDLTQFITNRQTDAQIEWYPTYGEVVVDGTTLTALYPGPYDVVAYFASEPDENGKIQRFGEYKLYVNSFAAVNDITPIESVIGVEVGQRSLIDLQYDPSWGTDRKIKWTYNANEVSIDEEVRDEYECSYFVTPHVVGDIKIEGISVANPDVTVSLTIKAWAPIEEIILPSDQIGINIGETYQLTWTTVPELTNQNLTFEAHCPANMPPAFSVDENGLITALYEGSGEIKISPEFGGNYRWIQVYVGYFPTSFTLENNDITLEVGESEVLTFTYEPTEEPNLNKSLRYSYDDPQQNVVRVDWWYATNEETGKEEIRYQVVARNYGEATITFKTLNGLEQTCHVLVKDQHIYPESVELLNPDINLGMYEIVDLDLRYTPDNGEIYKKMTWTLDDPAIAVIKPIDEYNPETNEYQIVGYTIGGENFGTTNFKGEVINGDGVLLCEPVYGTVTVKGVKILGGPVDLCPGESKTLEVKASSEEILEGVKFVSLDPAIATVSDDGVVTAQSIGNTFIKAYSEFDGVTYQNTRMVRVRPYPGEIALFPAEVTLYPENDSWNTVSLEVLKPESEYPRVDWDIIDGDCVAFRSNYASGSAEIYYVHPGTATVRATSRLNGAQTYCKVICMEYPESVELSYNNIVSGPDSRSQLNLQYTPDNWFVNKSMVWTIDDPSIAHVEPREEINPETGQMQIVGYYLVTDNFGSTNYKGEVIDSNGQLMCEPVSGTVTVEGIKILGGDRVVSLGDTFTLEVETSPNADPNTITFRSEHPSIASVSEDGVVTALAYGHACICAYVVANGSTYEYVIWVRVLPDPGTIALNPAEATLYPDGNQHLEVVFAENESSPVTWEVVEGDCVFFKFEFPTGEAILSYVKPGTAIVKATTEEGAEAYCEVTCAGIILNTEEVVMGVDMTRQITAELFPMTEDEELSYLWYPNNPDVATVDNNGLITAVGVGEATITVDVKAYGYLFYGYVNVRVLEDFVAVTNIMLNETNIAAKEGEMVQLIATVDPADATVTGLVWSSSDESVATVDQSGLVTILTEGTAVITVSATDGSDVKAVCYISGLSGVESIFVEGEPCDIYTVNGVLVKKSATADDFNKLSNGLYIIRCGGQTMKVLRGSN